MDAETVYRVYACLEVLGIWGGDVVANGWKKAKTTVMGMGKTGRSGREQFVPGLDLHFMVTCSYSCVMYLSRTRLPSYISWEYRGE